MRVINPGGGADDPTTKRVPSGLTVYHAPVGGKILYDAYGATVKVWSTEIAGSFDWAAWGYPIPTALLAVPWRVTLKMRLAPFQERSAGSSGGRSIGVWAGKTDGTGCVSFSPGQDGIWRRIQWGTNGTAWRYHQDATGGGASAYGSVNDAYLGLEWDGTTGLKMQTSSDGVEYETHIPASYISGMNCYGIGGYGVFTTGGMAEARAYHLDIAAT